MDLDKAFVASLVVEGDAAIMAAMEFGIDADLLVGEGRTAYEFVMDYFRTLTFWRCLATPG